jgi:hypothetical protein
VAVTAPPSPPVGPDDGVIEEAREHQRRRWWRAAGAAGGLAAIAGALLLIFTGGGGKGPPVSRFSFPFAAQPAKLSYRNGLTYLDGQPMLVGVAPDFTAGQVSLDIRLYNEGGAGLPYPTAATPAFGPGALSDWAGSGGGSAPQVVLVSHEVASMRVAHLGTFTPHRLLGLPTGLSAIAFLAPAHSQDTVLPPGDNQAPSRSAGLVTNRPHATLRETIYNSDGNLIPMVQPKVFGQHTGQFRLPTRFWQAPATEPAAGRCATSSTLPGATLQWGQVATNIAPDTGPTGTAFLSCLQAWYHWQGRTFDVGVLLNAQSPGHAPAKLWNTTPIPGHPGIYEIKAVEYVTRTRIQRVSPLDFVHFTSTTKTRTPGPPGPATLRRIRALQQQAFKAHAKEYEHLAQLANRHAGQIRVNRTILAFPAVAKRVGSAWVVVRDGHTLADRIAFLEGLHLTRANLSTPRS